MNSNRSIEKRERAGSSKLTAAKFIFITIFTVLCYLLARSMMNHHFMDGGRYHNQTQR